MYKIYLFLIEFCSALSLFPTILTKKSTVSSLIKKLYPKYLGYDLIRLGPKGDGGYLIPNDLEGIIACFSPGVELKSEFEKECSKLGMDVYLADKSVDGPATNDQRFYFTKKFVGCYNNEDFMTMDYWVNTCAIKNNGDLMLQMDIEGFEYETLINISENLMNRFRIIVVEFHSLEKLWSKPFFRLASPAFEKILQTHTCVHIHPNNSGRPFKIKGLEIPSTMEFTFLRNDRILNQTYVKKFPHPLDSPNLDKREVLLPKCWYDS